MEKIRKDFPLLDQEEIVFLDNASTTQKPKLVLNAVQEAYTKYNANPGRGIYDLAEQATEQYESARKAVAQFVQAKLHEIIFVRGATEGLNYIAQGWGRYHLKKGDRIVMTLLEHHANLVPWQRIAKETGAELVFIPIHKDGTVDMHAAEMLIDANTKMVSIVHVSNAIGTHVPVKKITELAHAVGAKVLVDACQSVPHEKVNVEDIGCDFLAFSGHKMFGPTGIGVLYMQENVQKEVEPFCLGGGSVSEVKWEGYTLADSPQRFEAGTPSLAQAIGLHAAIEYIKQSISFDALKKHEAMLARTAIEELSALEYVILYGPIEELKKTGHSITFTVKGMHAHDVAEYLNRKNICVRAGHFCAQPLARALGYDAAVRASFYAYTSKEDVEKFLAAMKELKNFL